MSAAQGDRSLSQREPETATPPARLVTREKKKKEKKKKKKKRVKKGRTGEIAYFLHRRVVHDNISRQR
jgi:hypothetical protein